MVFLSCFHTDNNTHKQNAKWRKKVTGEDFEISCRI